MKRLGYCFLIYNEINHESLWNAWFKNIKKSKYRIYIHYKYNKPLLYFEKYKIKTCIATKYSDITLVKAQNILIKEALHDNCSHIIFLSNSCIPLKSFDYVYNKLDIRFSYFNKAPDEACFPRCNQTLNYIDKKFIKKASQWCILNKKHALILINNNDYIDWFNNFTNVPDEHCYITKLYYLNLEQELILTSNLADGATTFTNWSDFDYPYQGHKGLKEYNYITKDELNYLLTKNCLFGRKINKGCMVISQHNKKLSKSLFDYLISRICL